MSKKNINRILIVAVALIWSVLIYKFINSMLVPDIAIVDNTTPQKSSVIPQIDKDTFNLKGYERDPFLGHLNRKRKVILSTNTTKVIKKETPIFQKWPKIEYLGFVKEEKANNPLLLVRVDNKLFRKKASGEFIEGLKIVSFYKDSIQVDFNNEKRIIVKH